MSNEEKLEELKQVITEIRSWDVEYYNPDTVKNLVLEELEGLLDD